MPILRCVRHSGVSFVAGRSLVHLWTEGISPDRLVSLWHECLVELGLSGQLLFHERTEQGDLPTAYAEVFPFLPLWLLREVLDQLTAGSIETQTARERLVDQAGAASFYYRTAGLYRAVAARYGWVNMPVSFSSCHSIVLGIGRHSRILSMNASEATALPLTLGAMSKAFGRDLLKSYGLPVPPGETVYTVERALQVAREVGYPVVLKRLVGASSDGVIHGIADDRNCRDAAERFLEIDGVLVVEHMLAGAELRLHFLQGKLYRVYRCTPWFIVGDGTRSILQLLAAFHPSYYRAVCRSTSEKRRFALGFWSMGVREFEELTRKVPEPGEKVRVSAATGAQMERVEPRDFLLDDDIARLEQFLRWFGSPSVGLDCMIAEPRASLSRGGILDINLPCGFGYLDDPADAVEQELTTMFPPEHEFCKDKGKVPVWLTLQGEETPDPDLLGQVRQMFNRLYPGAPETTLSVDGETQWFPILLNRDANAFLIHASERAILNHGMPESLAPLLLYSGDLESFCKKFPISTKTAANANGRLLHYLQFCEVG